MHVTAWPETEYPNLRPIIDRIHTLCPTHDVQTHLLHLASHGEILPHVDNVEASGSWILGVSLGAKRIMRMQNLDNKHDYFDVLLPSGSVYLQKSALIAISASLVHILRSNPGIQSALATPMPFSKMGLAKGK